MTEHLSAAARADLRATIQEWCNAQPQARDLAQAEAFAKDVGRIAAASAFEHAVEGCGTRAGYQGVSLPCACGKTARFVNYRKRWVRGEPGEASVTRAYYYCRACRTGRFPWDEAQGLDQQGFTPACKALMVERCAREGSYEEARIDLARHHHLDVTVSTLEAVVAGVGGRLRAAENEERRVYLAEGHLPPADPLLAEAIGARLYVSLDATKAHIDGEWHDVKVAACYAGRPPSDRQRASGQTWDRAGRMRYLGVQETAAGFATRAYLFALRLGCERAREVVVLGDGAEWIWKIAAEQFSDAVQILDFYHAAEYLWEIGRLVFGPENAEGERWCRECSEALLAEGVPGLLRGLRALRGRAMTPEVRREVISKVRYFRKHRTRLRYPEYRRRGMMVGSGPVEAGCKVVVGKRLKGAGMRWSSTGADAMLAIRTKVLGQQWETLARHARAA